MEEVGKSTPGDSSETDLLEMSQILFRQLKESKDREVKLQEKIRILEKEREVQNGPAATNQQHGVQELRQQIVELTQQFRQLKSVSDEKVQRLSSEVARLETEARDKDTKIKDMAVLENAHQSTIDSVRMEKDELQQRLDLVNAQMKRMRVAAYDQQLANRNDRERDRLNAESTATLELKAQLEKANEEIERLKKELDQSEHRLVDTQNALSEAERQIKQISGADVERKLEEYEKSRVELGRLQREVDELKTANELFEDKRETAALSIAQLQREQSSYETRIVELQLSASRVEEKAIRKQRELEDEMVALKERGKQVEECAKADAAELESTRKKVKDLEAGQLMMVTLLNGRDQEIVQLKEDLRQANMTSKLTQGLGNTSSSTTMVTTAVEKGHPAVECHANGSRYEGGGGNQHINVHATQERGASGSEAQRGNADRICATCKIYPVNACIKPCKHIVGCDKCLKATVKQKKKCPSCYKVIKDWAYIPL